VEIDHPYGLARQLPKEVREAFEAAAEKEALSGWGTVRRDIGEWIENPVWSPDGALLFGTNAVCVDAESRRVRWFTRAENAALDPDGRHAATVADGALSFHDAADGRVVGGPFAVGDAGSLHWAAGRPDRLAVLTPASDTAASFVHIFDAERHMGAIAIAHPQWRFGERGESDRDAWAWAPDGDRAACLVVRDGDAEVTVEIWSFADPAHAERLQTIPAPDTIAVLWGAGDTVVLIAETRVRFIRAEIDETVGDFTFLREPEGPPPIEGDAEDEYVGHTFTFDDDTWVTILEPDAVIAPPGLEDALDTVLTWSVGRRHAWPVRWGEPRVLPDALTAADVLDSENGEILRLHRCDLEQYAP